MTVRTSDPANRVASRATLAALVVMALLVPAAVAERLSARTTGTEVRLSVRPVDPIDPFRGAYVDLYYPDLASSLDPVGGSAPDESRVYVPLIRKGDVSVGGTAVAQRPDGQFIRCVKGRCGIESFFTGQAEATRWENLLRDGGTLMATVRVDRWGNAALVSLATASSPSG